MHDPKRAGIEVWLDDTDLPTIYNITYVDNLQVRREDITSGIAQFALADHLQKAVEEDEFYPPALKCRVRFFLPETERTVQYQLTIALGGAPVSFSYDIMQGKWPHCKAIWYYTQILLYGFPRFFITRAGINL